MRIDREPQPGDGPDYHTEHAFWVARQREANVAKTMQEVLAEHDDWTYLIQRNAMVCKGCGWTKPLSEDESSRDAFRAHQAAVLSAAGYGLVAEVRAQALEEAADHLMRIGWNNACTAHLRARAAAERGGE